MAEDGQKEMALERHARWLPGTSVLSTGLNLFKMGRMKAAELFLTQAWVKEGNEPQTGFALARVRVINGAYVGTTEYLAPYIASCIATAAPADVAVVLDTLRLCSGMAGVELALDSAARAMGGRPELAALVTDVYIAFARDDLDREKRPSSLAFFEKALGRDPNLLIWPVVWDLASQTIGVPGGVTLLSNLQARASAPAVRSGVAAKLAELRGDLAAAHAGYQASLKLVANQPELHGYLFDVSIKLGDLDQARRELEWREACFNEGKNRLRDALPLALMWTEFGDDVKAREFWQYLHLAMPDSAYYGIELAMAQFRSGRGTEAEGLLREVIGKTPTRLAYESLVQVLLAKGRMADARSVAGQGLSLFSSPSLRRSLAETLEALEGSSSTATSVLVAAKACLPDDPGSVPLSLMMGRALAAAHQDQEAVDWHEALLQRNPDFVPGLMFLRDQKIRMGTPHLALPYAEKLRDLRPWDDVAASHYAMNLAEADGFSRSIRILEPLAGQDQNTAIAILAYDNTTPYDYAGMNTVSQMVSHISALLKDGYVFLNSMPSGDVRKKSVMMMLVDPDAAVVEAVDAALRKNGAKAVIMVAPDNLRRTIPRKLSRERLAELKRSGRWNVGVTLPDMVAEKVRADGVNGNPLTHRIIVNEALESREAMKTRVDGMLSRAAFAIQEGESRWLYYPKGDYGQLSLDTDRATVNVLSNQVAKYFTAAFFQDDNGFIREQPDRLRLPSKSVSPSWNSLALLKYLREANPVVRSRLELAKLLYWHGQSEAAFYWFKKARDAGADPFEIIFNEAGNAAMEGDLPVALKQAREAVQQAPWDDARPAALLDKVMDMRKPAASLTGTAWRDNEDRSYWEGRGAVEGPVLDWLRWNAGISRHHWEKKELGAEEGSRADLGFLAYLAPEVWFQGEMQEWFMDDLPDVTGWQARLHIPNHWLHGNIELTSEREMMETVEALRKGITAYREGVETYSRVYDFWDCYVNGALTERSDGNSTWWASARIIRQLKETPLLGVGYAGSFADSTDTTPEYWAPKGLQKHQLYAALQATGIKWNGQLSGQTGYARELSTSWKYVWGARAAAVRKITKLLSAGGDVTYQGGPIYDRTTIDAFLNVRW
ncbi:MAG: hypothetical protein WCL16_10400 [bacterium]